MFGGDVMDAVATDLHGPIEVWRNVITWPSGTVQVLESVEANEVLVVTEPEA